MSGSTPSRSGASVVLTTKGDIAGYDTERTRIPIGSNDQVLTADSTNAKGVAWKTNPDITPPTSTKGDLSGYSTSQTRIPIGSNDQMLVADSSVALGLAWKTATASLISDFDTEVANNSAVSANTAKTGITSSQASAIVANTAKTGITSSQASAIVANSAKTGITSSQASAIVANTAKTGITSSQASAITANTAKTGITSSQASAITANTAKTTNATHSGEVTGSGALTIANNIVDEANLKVSNAPTNGYMLTAQSGNTGGLTWAQSGGATVTSQNDYLASTVNSNWSSSPVDSGLSITLANRSGGKFLATAMLKGTVSGSSSRNIGVRFVEGSTNKSIITGIQGTSSAQLFPLFLSGSLSGQVIKIQYYDPAGNTVYLHANSSLDVIEIS